MPRLTTAYRALALLCLNTFLLFALMNGCAAGWLRMYPERTTEGAMTYGLEKLTQVHPHRDAGEIRRLLAETAARPYSYEPYTQFKESPFSGEFVNVGPEGFRDTGHGLEWPPSGDNPAVFVFGGSTTFGYGLADAEAIPAVLQDQLTLACGREVSVYNVGRSNYFSSQENVLFQRLLADGIAPSVAVFVDGLNEFGYAHDTPKFTGRLSYLMRETSGQTARRFLVGLPLARVVKRWLQRPELVQKTPVAAADAQPIIDRWLRNRGQIRIVANAAGIETLFVWQPTPSYGYDLEHHLFKGEWGTQDEAIALGYNLVDEIRSDSSGRLVEDFLWLGDLQSGRAEALYVDRAHYTAAFTVEIAQAISEVVTPKVCPGDVEAVEPAFG